MIYPVTWFDCGGTTHVSGLGHAVIYEALCFDVAPGWMNGAPMETWTRSFRFASLVC